MNGTIPEPKTSTEWYAQGFADGASAATNAIKVALDALQESMVGFSGKVLQEEARIKAERTENAQ